VITGGGVFPPGGWVVSGGGVAGGVCGGAVTALNLLSEIIIFESLTWSQMDIASISVI